MVGMSKDGTGVAMRGDAGSAPVRRRMSAADRRLKILAAAERAFSSGPFHQVSLDDVAEAAGVSKALIYEHFSSKRDLYRALLAKATDDMMERIGAAVAGHEQPEARLHAGIEAFVDFVAGGKGSSKLFFHDSSDPDVTREMDRLRAEAANLIGSVMAVDLPASRATDAIPPEIVLATLAHQLIGALMELAKWWHENPEVEREKVVRMAMEFSWLGLDRLAAGERWPGELPEKP